MEQLLNFFISPAHADAAAAGPQGGGFSFFIIFGIFFVFMYFAIWRPQSKRAKEQRSLMDGVAKGDEIMTAGGLLGKVTKLNDQYLGLMVSPDVEILLQKSSVVRVLPKGTIKSIE